MINLFVSKIKSNYKDYINFVSPYKINELSSFKSEEYIKASMSANLLLQFALKKLNNLEIPQDISLDDNGKPFLSKHKDIYFNISHNDIFVSVAISNHPIGIDIENIKRKLIINDNLINKILTNNEKKYLIKLNKKNKNKYLIKLWTKKESCLKLSGSGINKGLNSIDTINNNCINLKNNKIYYLKTIKYKNNYISICLNNKDKLKIKYIKKY